MDFAELVPWITQGGVSGVIAFTFTVLHRSAVAAHREAKESAQQTAKMWREAWMVERQRGDEINRQIAHLISAVPTGASS